MGCLKLTYRFEFSALKVVSRGSEILGESRAGCYRYGFNGHEKDDEVSGSGNSYDFGARMYSPRLGRFLSVDPLTASYPHYTPYSFAGNKPITHIDKDGEHEWNIIVNPDANGNIQTTEISLVRTGAIGVTSQNNVGGDVAHYRNGNNGNRIRGYMVGVVNGGFLFNNEQSVINSAVAANPLPAGAGNTSWTAGGGTIEKIVYNNQTRMMTTFTRSNWQANPSFRLNSVGVNNNANQTFNISFNDATAQQTFNQIAQQYTANNQANFQITVSTRSPLLTGPNLTQAQMNWNNNMMTLANQRAGFLATQLINSGVPAANITQNINFGGGTAGASIITNQLNFTTQPVNPTNGSTGTTGGSNTDNTGL